jgi:hypothetical protein
MKSDIDAKIGSGASDAEVATFLKECGSKFSLAVLKSAQVPQPGKGLQHRPSQSGLAKGSVGNRGAASKKGKGAMVRRRSYGVKESKKFEDMAKNGAAAAPASDGMEVSASEPVLSTMEQIEKQNADMAAQLELMKAGNAELSGSAPVGAEATQDSWDSVSQLPYCTVCQMAFKSASQLTRHEKYSSLHASNKESAEKKAETEKALAKLDIRQEEGKDYSLLYFGSKFFWRTQDNVDISFYQHMLLHVIEVVPFDVYKGKPLDRLYFDKFLVESMIDTDVKKVVEAKKAELAEKKRHDKFGDVEAFDEAEEYLSAQRMEITTFILSRLQLHHIAQEGQGTKPKAKLVYAPLATGVDQTTASPLLEEKPDMLVPVQVTHRRNTSSAEVQAKMNEVEQSQMELKTAINKAEKITKHVQTFLSFSHPNRYKDMSVAKKRFVMAARKVIQIAGVEKTKAHLAALEAKKNPVPAKRRARASIRVRNEL